MAPGSARDSDSTSEPFSRLHLFLWPGLVLAISIAVTGFIVWNFQTKANLELHTAFQHRFVEVTNRLENQLAAQSKLLQGFKGLYIASGSVSRDEFRAYFDSFLVTPEESTVVAYHQLVSAKDLGRHVASVRNQGFPKYRISPAGRVNFMPRCSISSRSQRLIRTCSALTR